jgi:hypothetical protein
MEEKDSSQQSLDPQTQYPAIESLQRSLEHQAPHFHGTELSSDYVLYFTYSCVCRFFRYYFGEFSTQLLHVSAAPLFEGIRSSKLLPSILGAEKMGSSPNSAQRSCHAFQHA